MRILFISQKLPYLPCHDGFRLLAGNLLRRLAKKHEIHLISYIESKGELEHIPKLEKYCKSIDTVLKVPSRSIVKKAGRRIFRKILGDEMRLKIRGAIEKFDIDIIHVEGSRLGEYVVDLYEFPKIIAPHDCVSLRWYEHFKKSGNIFSKLMYGIYWIEAKHFESKIYRKFEGCVVVAPRDREALMSHVPELDIFVIPNGVDCEFFKPEAIGVDSRDIIFTGNMSYPPNVDAVLFFYKQIFPHIRKVMPDVKFYVVGSSPIEEIKELDKDDNVVVTGYVEDIRSYVYRSAVYICPIRFGTGIKNKILEAMAMGIPVVATSKSIDGIEVTPGENILVADDPVEFGEKTLRLLKDKELRVKIAKDARKLVEKKYSWERAVEEFEEVYRRAISKKVLRK
jgi:sugar transferase (PEP-CTERM/EpsH1 system associated)